MATVDQEINEELLYAAIRFNAIILGLVCGALGAVTIFAATYISVSMWGESAGSYLGLLGVFLPGYTPTIGGAFIGAFWAFIFGGLTGGLAYWLYGRIDGRHIIDDIKFASDPVFKPITLRLHGVPLGVAIGSVVGASLLLSTLWLVIRGTADESVNAALLSNYLPGYTVSVLGGVMGAIGLFIFIFICSVLLAFVYNRIIDIRTGSANK